MKFVIVFSKLESMLLFEQISDTEYLYHVLYYDVTTQRLLVDMILITTAVCIRISKENC